MPWIVLTLCIVAIVYGPTVWARTVLARNGDDRPDFPRTVGELARHLLDEAGLQEVTVELTERGDHYDPEDKAVRLTPGNLDGRSLTAITVAAHEVGHALQDRDNYQPLQTRTDMVRWTGGLQKLGSAVLFGSFLLGAITQAPGITLLFAGVGVATMASSVLVHLITLPVEFNASFQRALPILDQGGYLPPEDMPAARRILKACALTYVAASLAGLLNLWRWIRVFR